MPQKDPTTYALLTYIWVSLLAMAGGLVAFIRRLNKKRTPEPLGLILIKLIGELVIPGFAGLVTFYLCEFLRSTTTFNRCIGCHQWAYGW